MRQELLQAAPLWMAIVLSGLQYKRIYFQSSFGQGNIKLCSPPIYAKCTGRYAYIMRIVIKLMAAVRDAVKTTVKDYIFFTDSIIVLSWISAHPRKWEKFVQNLVSHIQEHFSSSCCNHVPGDSFPADCASRGITALDLLYHSLWWEGPQWLHSIEQPREKAVTINHPLAETEK